MGGSGEGKNVLCVRVIHFAFERLQSESVYAYPSETSRELRDNVAFYRPRPIGATTHYGDVSSAEVRDIDVKCRAMCFGDRVGDDAVVANFERMEGLSDPVKSTRYGVQSQRYTTLDSISKADNLEELD